MGVHPLAWVRPGGAKHCAFISQLREGGMRVLFLTAGCCCCCCGVQEEEEVVAAPAKPAFGLFGFGRKPQPVEEEEEEEEVRAAAVLSPNSLGCVHSFAGSWVWAAQASLHARPCLAVLHLRLYTASLHASHSATSPCPKHNPASALPLQEVVVEEEVVVVAQKKPSLFGAFFKKVEQVAEEEEEVEEEEVSACCALL